MNENFKQTLGELNADYIQIKGQPFSHFFCPILFKDEDVILCKAHAVLLPYFDQPESVVRFFDFLKNDKEEIDVALMRFEQGHFELTRATKIIWPKSGILYPDELPTQ